MKAQTRFSLWLILAASVLAACQASNPTTAAPPAATSPATLLVEGPIAIPYQDGETIPATVYGHGATLVILASMSSGAPSQWDPLVSAIDMDRFAVLTFSYVMDPQWYATDLEPIAAAANSDAIYAYVTEARVARIICIGASLGVTACGQLAHKPEIAGEALIAGPNNGLPLGRPFPKLFIGGADDPWAEAISSEYEMAAEPKKLVLFEGNAFHGTDILASNDGPAFLDLLTKFIDDNG